MDIENSSLIPCTLNVFAIAFQPLLQSLKETLSGNCERLIERHPLQSNSRRYI